MQRSLLAIAVLAFITTTARSGELVFKERMLAALARDVPKILKSFDPDTGRFGAGIWLCTDQNVMYPLAVAYATEGAGNRYYQDPQLLRIIAKSGYPLIEAMDATGQFLFQKKDGSTWGMIRMPWTYSRWIRAFSLVRDEMTVADREAWRKALTLAYTNIAKREFSHVHNIPTHHALGLYVAGRTLERPDWCKQAADFLLRVAGVQAEGGYWTEHKGPVVNYNKVYVDALGTYYALSRDERVLPALERSAVFHHAFTYPDGYSVETVDERNPFHHAIDTGNVGLSVTPLGRSLLKAQWDLIKPKELPADALASFVLYGQEGTIASPPSRPGEPFILREGGQDRAAVIRSTPWFICLSAYTAPLPGSRWHQDRQNLVSVWHQRTGLILGGGNTKLQPAWSNFTVGDTALLRHKPGDTSPDFKPKGKLYHIPTTAELLTSPHAGLRLTYGEAAFELQVIPRTASQLEYRVKVLTPSALPMAAHLTLIPHVGKPLITGKGRTEKLGKAAIEYSPADLGGSVTHEGCRLKLPPSASVHWPALPHNPYRKDGRAALPEGRIEIRIPLDESHPAATVTLNVGA